MRSETKFLRLPKNTAKLVQCFVAVKEQARHWKEAGALLLAYSSDSEILHNTFEQAMIEIKDKGR